MKRVLTVCLLMFCIVAAKADDGQLRAIKLSHPVDIDGKLTETVWRTTLPFSQFKQKEPHQGEPPSEKSEVWVAYDDNALYIAARLYDSQPDSIIALLSRKDNLNNADWFGVFIDPYLDRRTGNYFVVGPAGSVGDGVLYNDDWDSDDWDGVWEANAQIDEEGWTVEMKIPFSQLRFHDTPQQVWGINFRRDIGRKNEQDYLVYTPRMESGFVSRFYQLTGMKGIKPSNAVEVLPFATTKAEYTHPAPGNPFNNGSRYTPDLGADIRYGISSNLILNATVNPDFGQVEVDPAVVNLSDVESFFSEKRPFFVEGANIFTNYGQGGGKNYWNFNFPYTTPFYSRRIGRSPHGNDTLSATDFMEVPFATKILGAGKITGKVGDGWNVGTIHAVTAQEFADYKVGTVRNVAEVEPMTYYGVGRVQRDFNDGRQGFGILVTHTQRQFSNNALRNGLNTDGSFAGFDGWTFLDSSKTWVMTGYGNLSHVAGSTARITQLQRNSQHYFQRPDASHVKVDSNATSMSGYAGRFYLIKQQGNFFFNSSFGVIDPNYEVNDLGFLSRTDVINMHVGGGYNWTEPDGIFRRKELGGGFGQSYDYEQNLLHRVLVQFGYFQLINYYAVNWSIAINPNETVNNRRTRGGPLTLNKTGWEYNFFLNSDYSKAVVVEASFNAYTSDYSKYANYSLWIQYRPSQNITVSAGPQFENERQELMYIGSYDEPASLATYGKQYLFSRLDYKSISANIRLNWTFTPTLSLQLYLQPLISSGAYSQYKELIKPKSDQYLLYGTRTSTLQFEKTANQYVVDADGAGPSTPKTFDNPNFNFKSLRGNAVLRWEYLPGSVLYFVWTQNRSDSESNGELRFHRSLNRLMNTKADNIFLMKLSYYLNV
jgi:hypothetical protein